MASVSLLRAGYEKKLREAHARCMAAEAECSRVESERRELSRERDALRRILGVGEDGEGYGRGEYGRRRMVCERHRTRATDEQRRARSTSAEPMLARTLDGRVAQMREEIASLKRVLAGLERELIRRDGTIVALQSERGAMMEREGVLSERLRDAFDAANGATDKERILQAELDYAQSRLAAVSLGERRRCKNDTECDILRERLEQIQKLLSESDQKLLDQESVLEEMKVQIGSLIDERQELADRLHRTENKYTKCKADVMMLTNTVEALTDSASVDGRLNDGRSALQRARDLHERLRSADPPTASSSPDPRSQAPPTVDRAAIDQYQARLLDMIEDERAIARSLHEDLDATRKKLIDRDECVHRLEAELSNARIALSQAETESAIARGRADSAVAAQAADIDAYATALDQSHAENERLRSHLTEALKHSDSYKAKLEAQGRDLVAVKKELQRLQLQ